jgi:fumarate hydratase class II
VVEVSADKLWGAQTQRSLEHFSIGQDLIPREMIQAYAARDKDSRCLARIEPSTNCLSAGGPGEFN